MSESNQNELDAPAGSDPNFKTMNDIEPKNDPSAKHAKEWIPQNWTFNDLRVAERFDNHVREQLPWYDLLSTSIALIARHYIGDGSTVYDIGASTGNFGNKIRGVIEEREVNFIAIEKSREMASRYRGPGILKTCDALEYPYEEFDFAVCFLSIMFMPIRLRMGLIQCLCDRVSSGGAIVVVDKVQTESGYLGTVLRRMAMQWKQDSGTSAHEIVKKELSLAGFQRPLNSEGMEAIGFVKFFQFGEFAAWIIERPSEL